MTNYENKTMEELVEMLKSKDEQLSKIPVRKTKEIVAPLPYRTYLAEFNENEDIEEDDRYQKFIALGKKCYQITLEAKHIKTKDNEDIEEDDRYQKFMNTIINRNKTMEELVDIEEDNRQQKFMNTIINRNKTMEELVEILKFYA